MKLPLIFSGSGGGNSYHSYNESPFDQDDIDADNTDDLGSENTDSDFDEYMWMENEEEFDKIEWQRLEEEELMKQCMENMLEDDEELSDSENLFVWSTQCE